MIAYLPPQDDKEVCDPALVSRTDALRLPTAMLACPMARRLGPWRKLPPAARDAHAATPTIGAYASAARPMRQGA
jgi:hypothetical protein